MEIKQYIFEYVSAAVMLYVSVRLIAEYNTKNLAYFVAGGVFSIIFSFSAPIVIAAFGAGVIVQRWVTFSSDLKSRRQPGIILALLLLAIAFLVYYLGYTRPTTEIQFAAYANVYEPNFLTFPPHTLAELKLWLKFPNFLIGQLGLGVEKYLGIKVLAAVMIAVVFTVGIVTIASHFILLPASFIIATILIYGLSLAELLPIAEQRHFAFMVPITGIILGFGLFRCLRWLSRWAMPRQAQRLASASCALVIVFVSALGLVRSANLERQQVSPLIDYIISHENVDTPVWVYYGAQPAMRVMAPNTLVQLGLVSHSSDVHGWMRKNRNYPDHVTKESYTKKSYFDDFRRTIHGLPQLWLIFSHYWIERDGLQRYLAIAQEEVGGCRQVLAGKGAVLWKCN